MRGVFNFVECKIKKIISFYLHGIQHACELLDQISFEPIYQECYEYFFQ